MALPEKGHSFKSFLVDLKDTWRQDQVSDLAAGLTYRAVLALFPFLLFVVNLGGLVIDPAITLALIDRLHKVAPPEVTSIVSSRIESLAASSSRSFLTISFVGAFWAASSAVSALGRALNRAFGVTESRPFWKVRAISLLVTLAGAVLSIVASAVAVALPALADKLGALGSVLLALRFPVAGLLMMILWALLYYFLPDARQRFRLITPGSALAVVIWLAASWGFSEYVNQFGKFDVTYGALGGVIVLLLWMWISTQVVLLGAEVNAVLQKVHSG